MKKSMLPLDLEIPWNQVLRVFTSGVGMVIREETGINIGMNTGIKYHNNLVWPKSGTSLTPVPG
jgi:hypothetical protein